MKGGSNVMKITEYHFSNILLERLQIGLLAYFVIVISGVAVLPDDLRLQLGLPLIITALLGVGISAWLKFSFIPKFYFVDYIHAEK